MKPLIKLFGNAASLTTMKKQTSSKKVKPEMRKKKTKKDTLR